MNFAISHHLQWVILVIFMIGLALKKIRALPSGLIPVVLAILSVVICTCYSMIRFGEGFMMMLWDYGIPDGIPAVAIAALSWDTFHGLVNLTKKKRVQE